MLLRWWKHRRERLMVDDWISALRLTTEPFPTGRTRVEALEEFSSCSHPSSTTQISRPRRCLRCAVLRRPVSWRSVITGICRGDQTRILLPASIVYPEVSVTICRGIKVTWAEAPGSSAPLVIHRLQLHIHRNRGGADFHALRPLK